MRVALATAEYLPDLSPDDQVLFAELQKRGVDTSIVIWDTDVDWPVFDVVVARSIWDYHLKYARYLEWLADLDAAGVRVHNSTDVLRWNAEKRYLIELEAAGVRITPTRIVARNTETSLSTILSETGWTDAVVKPAVSASGWETWFLTGPCTQREEQRFVEQNSEMELLVQQFAPGVTAGEISFVFLGGTYSHAILKRAAPGEFRVHIEHGGTVEDFEAAPAQIEWASAVVAVVADRPWTYARVDAVSDDEGLMLMELEMLDPELFFKHSEAATRRMADLISDPNVVRDP